MLNQCKDFYPPYLFMAILMLFAQVFFTPAQAQQVPQYKVDPYWPKQLPNNWIMGQVGGISTDAEGHIWVLQRPLSLDDDERAASLKPPRAICCNPAPPVLVFDKEGNLLKSWGGPGAGYQWVDVPHGIHVDSKGFVWITGNGDKTDNVVLKFTTDGKFVGQIGANVPSKGSADTTVLGRPAETTFDEAANEVYIADGYGNHRVIVYDATSFAFKRMWGAYGNKPVDPAGKVDPPYSPDQPVEQQFRNPVHCVDISNDGLVYVCDRENNRVQIFKKDGTFVSEWFYEKNTLGAGSVWDIAFWPDKDQTFVLIEDGQNNLVRIVERKTGKIVGSFGHGGRSAGQFIQNHDMAIDKEGNIYTGEVADAKRAQKFVPNIKP